MRKIFFSKKRSNRVILILGAAVLIFISVIFIVVKFNEKYASKNIIINVAKRAIAEAGALLANFIKEKEKNTVSFGFNEHAYKNIEKIDEFMAHLESLSFNGKKIKIIKINNPDICMAALSFQYEDFLNENIRLLRNKYSLDKLVADISSDLEKFIILREWVRRRITEGKPKNVDYNFNALNILERAERGEHFFCSETATVFIQCVISLGYTGRYIGLFKGHILAEVWSNDFNKWVIMDVGDNLHYERFGVPLGALELHRTLEIGNFSDIDVVYGIDMKHLSREESNFYISYYHEFFTRMRNDWFSNKYPHWHPKGNSIMNSLEWQDQYTSNNILVAKEINNSEGFNFCLNVVSIMCDKNNSSQKEIHLNFNTFTPGFSHFLLSIDDGAKLKNDSKNLTWKLHQGINMIQVSAVNVLGVSGPLSEVELVIE